MSKSIRAFIVSYIYKSDINDVGYNYGHTVVEHTSLLPLKLICEKVETKIKGKNYVIMSVSEIEPLNGYTQPEQLTIE